MQRLISEPNGLVLLNSYRLKLYMQFFILYIDPGSGSYLLQLIIAAVLGVSFFFKNFWYKVKSFFTGTRPDKEKEKDAAD